MTHDDVATFRELNATREYVADTVTTQEQIILKGELTTDYKTGSSASAVYGKLNYKTTGSAHGMAQGITAEAILPNSSLGRGQVQAIDLEIGGGASTSWGSAGPVCFIRCGVWGCAAEMDTRGFLFDIQGLTEATGKLLSIGASAPAVTATLRVKIGALTKYIMLSDAEAT